MRTKSYLMGAMVGVALLGTGVTNAFAADETLRSLAEERGRYIGAILNSEWFGGRIESQFEQIHKAQFGFFAILNANVPQGMLQHDAIVL